jgi:hypothetical protein
MRAAAAKIRASNSSPASTFLLYTALFMQPHKQKSNVVMYGDPGGSISITNHNQTHRPYELSFSHYDR